MTPYARALGKLNYYPSLLFKQKHNILSSASLSRHGGLSCQIMRKGLRDCTKPRSILRQYPSLCSALQHTCSSVLIWARQKAGSVAACSTNVVRGFSLVQGQNRTTLKGRTTIGFEPGGAGLILACWLREKARTNLNMNPDSIGKESQAF
jgi:hypothetical protein